MIYCLLAFALAALGVGVLLAVTVASMGTGEGE